MTIDYTTGVYDLFRVGHPNLFQRTEINYAEEII